MPKGEDDFDPKKCLCGSGEDKEPHYDARGIFLTYACWRCEKEKLAGYRSDVLSDASYWADEAIEGDD
jgi:hypothetical protein